MRFPIVAALVAVIGSMACVGQGSTAHAAAPLPPPGAFGFHFAASPTGVRGPGYGVGVYEVTPDQCGTPGFVGVCQSWALAEAFGSTATLGKPAGLIAYIEQVSLDSSGVEHDAVAGVVTETVNGIAGPVVPGPTATQGGSGLLAVTATKPEYGTVQAAGFFSVSPSIGGCGVGVIQGGAVTISYTGTIFHQHWSGSSWVVDPTTYETWTFHVVPSPLYSQAIAYSLDISEAC